MLDFFLLGTLSMVLFVTVFFSGAAYQAAKGMDAPHFFQKWNLYVDMVEYGFSGRFAMKCICFIPTALAFGSWCKAKTFPAPEQDLN